MRTSCLPRTSRRVLRRPRLSSLPKKHEFGLACSCANGGWHVMIKKKCFEIFEEETENSLQWSSATLRLLSEARSPKRRSFVGCNLTSKRSAIKTRFEAACTVSASSSSEKSDSSGWWTCTMVEVSMSLLPGKTISPHVCPFWYINRHFASSFKTCSDR